jgi:hypothetical protein
MTMLRRPTPESRMIDLVKALAEDFHTVALPVVSEAVREAASGVDLDAVDSWPVIERQARHRLAELAKAG